MTLTTTAAPARWAIVTAYVGGVLLAVTPALVELVAGDLILLLPLALLLALVALWPLRGGLAHRVFVIALALALLTEVIEQVAFSGDVPRWADVPPPVLFTIAGIALLATARNRSRALVAPAGGSSQPAASPLA